MNKPKWWVMAGWGAVMFAVMYMAIAAFGRPTTALGLFGIMGVGIGVCLAAVVTLAIAGSLPEAIGALGFTPPLLIIAILLLLILWRLG